MENKEIKNEIDQANEGFADVDTVTHHIILHRLHDKLKADGYRISQAELWKYHDFYIDIIIEALSEDKTVKLARLVELKKVNRAARNGVNPQTREALQIPAKRVVKARPLSDLTKLTEVIEENK